MDRVSIRVSGSHGRVRVDDKFGVPYEMRQRVINMYQSFMGPGKIAEEMENDRLSRRLMDMNVALPTPGQIKNLCTWYRSKVSGCPRSALSTAEAIDFAEYMRVEKPGYSLKDENELLVLENRMGSQEGFVFTSRKVRRES
eukprot:GHVU01143008.1.p2 GENE.GHVU01143008.1~~GHVU01143008.1.p2  ORF type:complete len:141 (+),score=11.13 GHVU01143008.1:628-1050(+)